LNEEREEAGFAALPFNVDLRITYWEKPFVINHRTMMSRPWKVLLHNEQ
jgi:hypothetical protein